MNTINLTTLSSKVEAYNNCIASNNTVWQGKHLDSIEDICKALPHGSGIDGKFEISLELCTPQKLVFFLEFHHMDTNGYYCGWTEHNLIITPNFGGFNLRITGKNFNDIKDYLTDTLSEYFSIN